MLICLFLLNRHIDKVFNNIYSILLRNVLQKYCTFRMLLLPAQVNLSNHHLVHFTVDVLFCLLALQNVYACGGALQRRSHNNVITNYTTMSKRTYKCSIIITAYQNSQLTNTTYCPFNTGLQYPSLLMTNIVFLWQKLVFLSKYTIT